jgi:hypothetical protein
VELFHNGETCHSASGNKIDFNSLKTGVFAGGVGIDKEHTEGGFNWEVVDELVGGTAQRVG